MGSFHTCIKAKKIKRQCDLGAPFYGANESRFVANHHILEELKATS